MGTKICNTALQPSKILEKRWIATRTRGSKIRKILALFYVKRCDAFNCASTGAHISFSTKFKSPSVLPNGLNGIVIFNNSKISTNVTIFHQVTIGEGKGEAPTIGDNCYIGAGTIIIGDIKAGDNVRI